MSRKITSPNCSTCQHFRPEGESYPHCVKRNVREGWGPLMFMPVEPEEVCPEHEEAARDA